MSSLASLCPSCFPFHRPEPDGRSGGRDATKYQINRRSADWGAIVVRQTSLDGPRRWNDVSDIETRKKKRSNACVQRTSQLSHRVRVLLEGRKVLRMCTVAQTEEERLVARVPSSSWSRLPHRGRRTKRRESGGSREEEREIRGGGRIDDAGGREAATVEDRR